MERSLINEFKGSNSTLFHSTVLGTTSLLQRNKEGDLYKSRIAHLPSDPRPDLSRKLDFVVVFQAIEIQRLTQEAVFLRGRLRETEGRGLHQTSYEVQIRELMERCNKLEGEKYSYREELAQTKAASESIFHQLTLLQGRYSEVDFCAAEKYKLEKGRNEELVREIQKWKGRYTALEQAKGEEQEGLRKMMSSQKQAFGSREAKDIMSRFELEKEQLLGRLRERKQQLDERELEIKKLQNCYEQLQVRTREDNAKVDSYEQKVAMLSQQTFRLNELVRAKSQEIRNLKLINEQDFSLKMSQFNSLDETRHFLNDKVRMLQDQNDQIREEGRALSQQIAHMKRKVVEVQRLEFQLREAKDDCQSKLRAMERKDKKIIALQQQIKQTRRVDEELKRLKNANLKLEADLEDLNERLDIKIEQLRQAKQEQAAFLRWRDDFDQKLKAKLHEFTINMQSLERQNSQIRIASQKNIEHSANFELKTKQFAIQLKEKDYHITSLQNELKQQEAKIKTKEAESRDAIQQLQSHLFAQQRNFEKRLKDTQAKSLEWEQYVQKAELKCRQTEGRSRDAQLKLKNFQSSQLRARSLQAECNNLEAWGRSLQSKNHQMQLHIMQLQSHLVQMEQEGAQMRGALQGQMEFYRQVEQRYFESAQEMKTLKARLQNIQRILITLKNSVGLRMKTAQEQDRRLHAIEQRYQDLFQWFISMSSKYQSGFKESPTKTPYQSFFGNNENSRFSTSFDRSSLSPLHRARSSQRTRENFNSGNNRQPQEVSLEAALRHVLLCVEVESLRKRVGDKNAKVESMRNSIVVKGYGHPSGFLSGRQPSASKKTTIYY